MSLGSTIFRKSDATETTAGSRSGDGSDILIGEEDGGHDSGTYCHEDDGNNNNIAEQVVSIVEKENDLMKEQSQLDSQQQQQKQTRRPSSKRRNNQSRAIAASSRSFLSGVVFPHEDDDSLIGCWSSI